MLILVLFMYDSQAWYYAEMLKNSQALATSCTNLVYLQ
jgi:hypothetical protein